MPAKEADGTDDDADKRGTNAYSGSRGPGAAGGSNAGGDNSQTGEAGSPLASIK